MSSTKSADEASVPAERSAAHRMLDEIVALVRRGEAGHAETLLAEALQQHAGLPRLYAVQGYVLVACGRFAEAIMAFGEAVSRDPAYLLAWQYLAGLRETTGDLPGAIDALDRILALEPERVDAVARRITLLAELGGGDEALAEAVAARARFPDAAAVAVAHGLALRRGGRLTEALAVQEAVLRRAPQTVAALGEKGAVLHALGRFEAALEAYDEALEQDENNIFALSGVGLAELELGMHDAARAAFDKVLSLQPWRVEALFYRALSFEWQGRIEEALAAYQLVLEHQPGHAFTYNNIGKLHRDAGRLDEAAQSFRRSLELAPMNAHVHSNLLFTMLYDPRYGQQELFDEHLGYGRVFGHPPDVFDSWPNDLDPDRRLRVGIISAEFFSHALSDWLLAALESIDRTKLDLVCFYNRHLDDVKTKRFRGLADDWYNVTSLTDDALARLVRDTRIDILIDVTGHTAYNRLPCLARHPAPVQATWLGYPFTTGLPAVDYILMDPVAVRPGEEKLFVEEVVRLPGGRFCYSRPLTAPAVTAPPALANSWITFGSFNAVPKLTDRVLAVWQRILLAVPDSRLVLQAPTLGNTEVAARISQRVCGDKISPDRITLNAAVAHPELLTLYGGLDVALDPFPFSGGLTTCEALWMGVPVITLQGWQVVSRQSETCLVALGRSEWVATDEDHYVTIAVELAADPAKLATMRVAQRERMARSPLCDKYRFGRELADALRGMWRTFTTSPASHR